MRLWITFFSILILAIAVLVTVGQPELSATAEQRETARNALEVRLEPGLNGVTPTATPAPTQVPTPPARP
jgi:hypothetical protein